MRPLQTSENLFFLVMQLSTLEKVKDSGGSEECGSLSASEPQQKRMSFRLGSHNSFMPATVPRHRIAQNAAFLKLCNSLFI